MGQARYTNKARLAAKRATPAKASSTHRGNASAQAVDYESDQENQPPATFLGRAHPAGAQQMANALMGSAGEHFFPGQMGVPKFTSL